MKPVVILPAAEDDLDAAAQFYDQQATGLGDYFTDTLASDLDSLGVHGGVHRKVYGFHRCVSRHFPYGIYYRVESGTVRVYAVLDCRRDPKSLRARLLGR